MNVLNRPAIKFEARNFISIDKRWLYIFLAGIVPFVVNLCNGFVEITVKSDDIDFMSQIFYSNPLIVAFIMLMPVIYFLISPINVALSGYYTNCLRTNDFKSQYVYSTASNDYIKFLVVELVKSIFIFFWTCLFVIPGIIKGVAYSMSRYVICDNPNLSSTEAISLSRKITKGFKGDIFIMYLSFIPWLFLQAITMNIASIYVIPYMGITEAMFYENLKKHAIETGVATPNEFGIY